MSIKESKNCALTSTQTEMIICFALKHCKVSSKALHDAKNEALRQCFNPHNTMYDKLDYQALANALRIEPRKTYKLAQKIRRSLSKKWDEAIKTLFQEFAPLFTKDFLNLKKLIELLGKDYSQFVYYYEGLSETINNTKRNCTGAKDNDQKVQQKLIEKIQKITKQNHQLDSGSKQVYEDRDLFDRTVKSSQIDEMGTKSIDDTENNSVNVNQSIINEFSSHNIYSMTFDQDQ